MEIKVTFEDIDLSDIAIQYLAEQTHMGNVEEWIWSLVHREIWAQPSYRVCPECHETYYPIYQTREVHNRQDKFYRVDLVGAVEACHDCGCATVPDSPHEVSPRNAELNRRFLAGVDRNEIFNDLPHHLTNAEAMATPHPESGAKVAS